jgi:hypothetical protein
MALDVMCSLFCFYKRNGQIAEEGVGKTYDLFYSYIFGRFNPVKIRPGPIARLKTQISCFPELEKNWSFPGKFPTYFAVLR